MEALLYEERSYRLLFPSYFKIYSSKIEAYFLPFRYTIPISSVKEVKIRERIPWYVGWGLRLNPLGRELYFALHHGRSVEIEKNDGYWKRVILAVKQPEQFAFIVKERMKAFIT
ncbi:MAG: hypothetical protein QXJ68_05295 [Methanocellales archaeon]